MASVASQLIEEVTAHAQNNSLEDAREICADGTYFPNNLRTYATKNSNEIGEVLNNIHITNPHKMATLVIKDLYILPIKT